MSKFYCGCDVGSTYTKCVIIDENKKIVSTATIKGKIDCSESARVAIDEAIKTIDGIKDARELTYTIATGYGRLQVENANDNVSEISCHAMGVHAVNPSVRTIIDIGGQDVKSINVDTDGTVKDFLMNDKCAAGTGRFFEAMAGVLDVKIEDFSDLSLKATKPIYISSVCSVFAETEAISLIAQRTSIADIAQGVQVSVAKRCYGLAKGVGIVEDVTISGGCARNEGLILALEKELRVKMIRIKENPQLMGALGAAVYAHQKASAKGL